MHDTNQIAFLAEISKPSNRDDLRKLRFSRMNQLLALNGLVHLPLVFIRWQTMRQKEWAVKAGLVLCAVNLFLPIVFVSLSIPPLFGDIYTRVDASGYFAMTSCMLVLLAELGQLLLYAAAAAAQRSAHAQRGH